MSASNTSIMKAFRGEPTDRIPFWEVWFGMWTMAECLVGGPIDSPERQIALARRLGWETVRTPSCSHGLPHATETASDGKRRYAGGKLRSLSQLEAIPPVETERLARETAHALRLAHEAGMAAVTYLPWCFHAVNTALGLAEFSYKLSDDIGFIETAMDFVEQRSRQVIREVVIPCEVDFVLFDGDCAYKTGLMINPRMFRKLVFDRTRETVAPLRAAGIPYTFHSDGKVDEFAPVIIELGFSAMHGIEAMANDLADIKQRFGKEITLVGNMDVGFLAGATPEDIRRATERMLQIGLPGGRYIAACNTSPLDNIPQENYLAMVDVMRNYGGAA